MRDLHPLQRPPLHDIDTLVFAGGGNRCWWQAGVVSHLMDDGWRMPALVVGTSAGAAIAASALTDSARCAFESCRRLFGANDRVWHWSQLRFAHQHIYPAWIASFMHTRGLEVLRGHATQLRVALTRPARLIGVAGSVAVGTVAYLIDKYIGRNLHPQLPSRLGLRQDFVNLHDCRNAEEAQQLLQAAAAAPPFMRAVSVGTGLALDGGYTDNAPIQPQTPEERARTLVLLTRHYPHLPMWFRWRGRAYWQPSRKVPVSTWDCTSRATVHEAFALGEHDAASVGT